MAFEGKKIQKKDLEKFEKDATLAGQQKGIYENFVQNENMILLKCWIGHIVKENFQAFFNILNKDKDKSKDKEKLQEEAGMKSYIGSWLGYAGAKPDIKPANSLQVEQETEQIQQASEQIFQMNQIDPQRVTEGPAGSKFNATFNLKKFRLCLIDDSKVVALAETGDPFQDFELSEIIVDIRDLALSFDSFDEDNIGNKHSSEIKATLGDLGLLFIEKFE